MTLKFPNSDVDFVVTPAFFLGNFDVYDREETLGQELNLFDPNENDALSLLMDRYFFQSGRVQKLKAEHKAELLRVLSDALADSNYNFAQLVAPDVNFGDAFSLPSSWEIQNPRQLFARIHSLALERWFGVI